MTKSYVFGDYKVRVLFVGDSISPYYHFDVYQDGSKIYGNCFHRDKIKSFEETAKNVLNSFLNKPIRWNKVYYINVDSYLVKVYFKGDSTSRFFNFEIIKEETFLFFKWYKILFKDFVTLNRIQTLEKSASLIVEKYKRHLESKNGGF